MTVKAQMLTASEGRKLFNAAAQHYVRMSGDEFLRRWDAGEYDAPECDRSDIVRVAMLIPFAR